MTDPILPEWRERPINRRVTAKYNRCQERGGCVPSKHFIWRDGQHVPTCSRCDVPMLRRASVWRGYAA